MAGLSDPVFDDSSRETLLAYIGTQIGHEMNHAFDTESIMIDADGKANPCLTEASDKIYREKVASVAGKDCM